MLKLRILKLRIPFRLSGFFRPAISAGIVVIMVASLLLNNSSPSAAYNTIVKLAFSTAPQTVAAGSLSGIITIEAQDASSNPTSVTTDTVVELASTSTSGIFYRDAAGLAQITAVTISSENSTASFYYKDTTAGTSTINAAESPALDWTNAVQVMTIEPVDLDHFTFTDIVKQTAITTFNITIKAHDSYHNTVTSYSGINTLTATTGTITPTETGPFIKGVWTGEVTIDLAQSGAFISTSGEGKTGSSNTFRKLIISTAPQTIKTGSLSGIISIGAQDALSAPVSVAADTAIDLSSSSASGIFYSDATGLNQITVATISAGTSSTSLYYTDTTAGTASINAAESPSLEWADAAQPITIEAAALDHFYFTNIDNQIANNTFSITITAKDIYGTTVTSYSGSNTLTDTTGTIAPTETGAFTEGVWTGEVTIDLAQSGACISTSGEDKTGDSNNFDILSTPPIILCIWEQDNSTFLEDGDASHANQGPQFLPPLIYNGNKNIEYYAIVTDLNGVEDIADVTVDLFYPEGLPQDGAMQQQLVLEPLPIAEALTAYAAARDAGLVTYQPNWTSEGQTRPANDADILQLIDNETESLWKATAVLGYAEPAGDYTVKYDAVDTAGDQADAAIPPTSLSSVFTYLATAGIEVDFSNIDYGTIQIENPIEWTYGDAVWDSPMDGVLKPNPASVRNIGNVPVYITLTNSDMGFDFHETPTQYLGPTQPEAAESNWYVYFGARLGINTADERFYDPDVEVTLPNWLAPGETNALNLLIRVKRATSGQYSGNLNIGCQQAPY